VKGLAAMRAPSLLFQTRKEPSLLSITDYRIAVIIGEEKREFATVMARIAVSVEKSRGQVSDPGLNQRPVPLILRGLIGGPFSLSRDKILPYRPLMSFPSHPVATTRRRFRLNFWNLGRIAVPLHRQSDKTSSGRRKQEN